MDETFRKEDAKIRAGTLRVWNAYGVGSLPVRDKLLVPL
jgi:hypothetical protein